MLYIETRKWDEGVNFRSRCDGHPWLRDRRHRKKTGVLFFLTDSLRTEAASQAAQTPNLFLQERYRLSNQRAMDQETARDLQPEDHGA